MLNELTIQLLTKRQNNSTTLWFSHASYYETSAWKKLANNVPGIWLKENHFLEILDDEYLSIKLTCTKDSVWLKLLGYSNSLYVRATRAITDHISIEEYCLRFFPRENFNCSCGTYPVESRCHILYECRRYNNYWNPNRESLSHFVAFLEYNTGAFSFHEGIT